MTIAANLKSFPMYKHGTCIQKNDFQTGILENCGLQIPNSPK